MPDDLVRLPHSGLRVPHIDLHVTAARTLPGTDDEMLNATLRMRTRIVGYLLNEGRGGPTSFQPTGTGFGWRDLHAYVAACRNPAGAPVTEEQVLDLLVDEYRTVRDGPLNHPVPPPPRGGRDLTARACRALHRRTGPPDRSTRRTHRRPTLCHTLPPAELPSDTYTM